MDVRKNKYLWDYLSQGQKDLLSQGEYLIDTVVKEGKYSFSDYSFLVFPFAKAYEGFLKQVFLDVKFIKEHEYNSDHFRLGKVLSPHLEKRLGERSVYKKICQVAGCDLSDLIWNTWKLGRNQVFHYFPHNLRSLTLDEAEGVINQITTTMEEVSIKLRSQALKNKLSSYFE